MDAFEEAQSTFRLPVFNPFGPLPTNAYLLAGDSTALFDVGADHQRTWDDMVAGLRLLGRKPEDVDTVILSHGHADHDGMAHRFRWARVFIGAPDLRKIADYDGHLRVYEQVVRGLLPLWGLPDELAERIPSFFRRLRKSGNPVSWAEPLEDGAVLEGFGDPLRVVFTPGHSEGLICLHREADSVLFSADQLLEHVIPNPSLYIKEDPPGTGLGDYMASCHRILEFAVRKVLPGHGPSFTRFKERVREVLDYEERRFEESLAALGSGQTVYELSRSLFPSADNQNAYFAFVVQVESYGRLRVLEERGLVISEREGGIDVYRRT